MNPIKLFLLSSLLALASCGGGGGETTASPPPQVFAPIAASAKAGGSCDYPAWDQTTKYTYQTIVSYQGAFYEAWKANTNKVPSTNVPTTWRTYSCTQVILPIGQCAFSAWQNNLRYMPGDRVMYLGRQWQSLPLTASMWNVYAPPDSTPQYWGELICTEAAPTPPPAPAPEPAPTVTVGAYPTTLLQVGNDWMEDGVWGAAGLTRGTYTGITGSTYEQYIGVSPTLGTNGEVAGRMVWKFPTGSTEVKSYPSFIVGAKPGWFNSWVLPGGFDVQLTDGSKAQIYPSGATPNSFLPLQLSTLPPVYSSFNYVHNEAPTGRGHLTYDIFLQNTPAQCHGFDNCGEITHEIMIPLDFWGGYGQYKAGGGGRNPSWYIKDVTIDGRLFHLFAAQNADGTLTANFGSGWKFIVFEPDQPIAPGTLNLTSFTTFIQNMKDSAGTPWANGSEWLVSVELGVEAVDGTGDLTLFNYRVWK